ncbi:MAG: hypothetical protein QXF45_05585 [Candidatus Caldarchaeum sp.]
MPYFIRCVDEDTWLTESRSIATWRALEMLAKNLMESTALQLPHRRKIYSKEEAAAWTMFFFKVRDYKPNPTINISDFYTSTNQIDYEKLASTLGVKPDEAASYVKTFDKPLMMAAVEEALQAVRHSYQYRHLVELVKGRV